MQFDAHGAPRWMSRCSRLIAVLAVALVTSGCGSDLAQVTGLVTVDGQPLRGGDDVRVTVIFQPSTGAGRVAVGLVNEEGRYHLSSGSEEGVVPGEYVATCSATQLVRAKDGGAAGGRRLTDPSYASSKTSGLTFIVEPGKNEIDLPLSSRPGAAAPSHAP